MSDIFEKETVKRFGARGSSVFEHEQKTTDLEDLAERVEKIVGSFCTCGAQINAETEVYRCCICNLICCTRCQIRHSRMSRCPLCARQQFALDKHAFLSLMFIAKGIIKPDDLIIIETVADEPVEITIDPAATVLSEHEYVVADGSLSAAGKEALYVGKQIYGEDSDVQAVMDTIRVQEVANR